MIRLFVFDLDGTLVDSLRDLTDSANELLGQFGAGPLDVAEIGRMVGEGAATLVARACAAAKVACPPDALDRFLRIYDTRLLNHTRPYDGMKDVVAALAAQSALAVLTNKPLAATKTVLRGVGLAPFFDDDGVIGGDGPWPRKPDPAGLLHLCGRVSVTPLEVMLVGDSLVDWQTARRAGAKICLARYGFGFREFPAETLDGSEWQIDTPVDLLRLRTLHGRAL